MPRTIIPAELLRPDLRAAIVDALQRTYDICQERHDESVGDDALTFGIHTWKTSSYLLPGELADLRHGDISWQVENQSLEVRVGSVRLRCLKLGHTEEEDPWESFPDHSGPASRMGRVEQLELDLGLAAEKPLDWVICHYGSVDEGLRAVRLQAVGAERASDGRIARWSAVETLYQAVGDTAVDLIVLPGPPSDVVTTPEPNVALKDEEQPEQHDGNQPS